MEFCFQEIDDDMDENEESKIIIYFKDNKYDITNFISSHPGGEDILYENKERDIEKLMIDNNHSSHAYQLLEKYLIKN